MLIRYLKDGFLEVSGDEEVVGIGRENYFIWGNREQGIIKAIPPDLIISKIYPEGVEAPYILDFIKENPNVIKSVDYSLVDRFEPKTVC